MQLLRRSLGLRGVAPALAIAGMLSLQPATAHAADAKHVGVGVACAFGNLLYGPAKLLLAGLGTLTAGLGYAVTAGDIDVARKILDSSVMGNYVVEPDHVTGAKQLAFIGEPNPPAAEEWSAAPQNNGF